MTADNTVFAYISTNPAAAGTEVATGETWQNTTSFSGVALTPGVVNYLHLEVVNRGNIYGLLGTFSLSGTGASFANGSTVLNTNTTDWSSALNDLNGSNVAKPWVATTGGVVSEGTNSASIWDTTFSGISPAAQWIGVPGTPYTTNNGLFTVDYSTAITVPVVGALVVPVADVPEPATLLLLSVGLAGLYVLRRRARA